VDYALMTVSDVPKQTYASAFAGDFRFSDLLLAHHVVTHADAVSGAKPVTYLGRRHHRLAVRMAAEEKPFDVYVDAETGLLTRVEIQRPFGLVNVIFSRHARSDGVRYAKENRSFLGDRLVEYDTDCTVTVNQDIGAAIRVEESLRPAPEMVDTSTMTVDRLGPDLYLVGRDDYSLFVEHAGRFIAVSTYAGFGARVDALGAELGRDIELSDVIVTQHHDDQLAGVEEAVKRGASLWVTGEARKVLAATSRAEGAAVRVLAEEQSIGPLTVFVRATGHAQESAFVFHERRGVLFQDLYHALYRNRANWAQPTAIAMHRMLVEWSWPVRVLVSGHGRKAEAWSAFEAAVERSAPRPMCPSQREICQELFLR
ncbi:MAG: MBL fold metallo-hydrolase, partial [Myxococcota bacterium]